jgi:hypothetical protein
MADFNLLKPLKEDYGTLKNFVDGEWLAPQTERFLPVTDPWCSTNRQRPSL